MTILIHRTHAAYFVLQVTTAVRSLEIRLVKKSQASKEISDFSEF